MNWHPCDPHWIIVLKLFDSKKSIWIRLHTALTPSNIRELPILCFHGIMAIYPNPIFSYKYPIFFWIIFINDRICILSGSSENIFYDRICYTKNWGVTRVFQFSQHSGKFSSPRRKKGNYLVINIYYPTWEESP